MQHTVLCDSLYGHYIMSVALYSLSLIHILTAWEILLTDFPAPWQRFAVQGYLHDIDRRRHYRADVSQSYDVHLRSIKASLIRRTASDHSYAPVSYTHLDVYKRQPGLRSVCSST